MALTFRSIMTEPEVADTEPAAPEADDAGAADGQALAASGAAAVPPAVAELRGVHKGYRLDDVEVPVIRGIDLLIRPGNFTVLLGPSGSGKTTLLNMLGCIDRPDQGDVIVNGTEVGALDDDALSDFRGRHIGFIFQNFNLLPVLTAYENIEYPLVLAGASQRTRADRVPKLLDAVGLTDKAKHRPGQLSGGQRQRIAIARALAMKPKLVIADEPTANLDSKTGAAILALMRHMQRRHRISFVFASHDPAVFKSADDALFLKDGVIVSHRRNASRGDVA